MIHAEQPRCEQAVRVSVLSSPSLCLPSPPTPVTPQLLITPHPNPHPSGLLQTDGSKKKKKNPKPKHSDGYPAKPGLLLPHCWAVRRGCPKRPEPERPQHGQGLLCHTATAPRLGGWVQTPGAPLPRFVQSPVMDPATALPVALLPGCQGEVGDDFGVPAGRGESRGVGGPPLPAREGAGSTARADPARPIPSRPRAPARPGSTREAPRVPTCRKHGDTRQSPGTAASHPPRSNHGNGISSHAFSTSLGVATPKEKKEKKKGNQNSPPPPAHVPGHAGNTTHTAGTAAGTNGDVRCGCAGASAALEKRPRPKPGKPAPCWKYEQDPAGTQLLVLEQHRDIPPCPSTSPSPQIFLPGHKCALPGYAGFSSTVRPSPCLAKLLVIPQSIPRQAKRVEFNPKLDTRSVLVPRPGSGKHRASGFSRHHHHTGVSGHVPRGALWHTPNQRDL